MSAPPDLLVALYAVDVLIWDSAALAASIIACILSATVSVSEATLTETPVASADTLSVTFGATLLKVLVLLVTGLPGSTRAVVTWALASAVTSKPKVPAAAPAVAVATTPVVEEVALTDRHVGFVGIRGEGWVNASAAVCRAASLLFTDWYAEMTVFSWATWFFRSVCGCAASCMSCAITCVVFIPLTRPSTVVELDTGFLPPGTPVRRRRGTYNAIRRAAESHRPAAGGL